MNHEPTTGAASSSTPAPASAQPASSDAPAQAHEPIDIFLWANQTDAIKDQLEVEFFLFKTTRPIAQILRPS